MTVSAPDYVTLDIESYWDGARLPAASRARVTLAWTESTARVDLLAPWFGDPAPRVSPGSVPRLWEYEVVELFVAGPADHYLELEFGPHDHYLALRLEGERRPVETSLELEYEADRQGDRWRGTARVSLRHFPPRPWRVNAYQIHASRCDGGQGRCHHAHSPVPGDAPDFHRLECFRSLG